MVSRLEFNSVVCFSSVLRLPWLVLLKNICIACFLARWSSKPLFLQKTRFLLARCRSCSLIAVLELLSWLQRRPAPSAPTLPALSSLFRFLPHRPVRMPAHPPVLPNGYWHYSQTVGLLLVHLELTPFFSYLDTHREPVSTFSTAAYRPRTGLAYNGSVVIALT